MALYDESGMKFLDLRNFASPLSTSEYVGTNVGGPALRVDTSGVTENTVVARIVGNVHLKWVALADKNGNAEYDIWITNGELSVCLPNVGALQATLGDVAVSYFVGRSDVMPLTLENGWTMVVSTKQTIPPNSELLLFAYGCEL